MKLALLIAISVVFSPLAYGQSEKILVPQEIRPLPGHLDRIPVFNSNSPEVVKDNGILLSTFSKQGKAFPAAHLDRPVKGRFDVFAHHISNQISQIPLRTLYMAILVGNAQKTPVKIKTLQAATYVSQPDAPFVVLPSLIANDDGTVYAGPGDRVTNDILKRKLQAGWPRQIKLAPSASALLLNVPIPVKELTPPLNGRTVLARLVSDGPVYLASLAMYAPVGLDGQEHAPSLKDWQAILESSSLVQPREKPASKPGQSTGVIYGRVSGMALGSVWQTKLLDPQGMAGRKAGRLTAPKPGKSFSYVISSVEQGTLGTGQVQSAPLVVRNPDTAFAAHGNYGIEYDLALPLYNASRQPMTVSVSLQTPIKTNEKSDGLLFYQPPPEKVFFRGTVRLKYLSEHNKAQTRYVHLVQRQGEQGLPLVSLKVKPGQTRMLNVTFLYPPDSTPPQVLTISSQGN